MVDLTGVAPVSKNQIRSNRSCVPSNRIYQPRLPEGGCYQALSLLRTFSASP